jgi:DNA polymerase III delta prime subunit
MKNLLLNERWRPKKIEDMVILPRIKEIFKNGLTQNVILHGHYGTGKTTLARILIGKWSKDSAFLELNSSFYTSIDTLRTKIDDFCSNVYMGLDLLSDVKKDTMKYVFLDEFERTSPVYQDALKAYLEEYSTRNVRFIFSTNHIDKVSDGMKSRMLSVDFNFQSNDEIKHLKREIYIRICKVICPAEKIVIAKETVVNIINDSFPDFRKILNNLQYFTETGNYKLNTIDDNTKELIYNLIEDKSQNYEKVYQFVNGNIGSDNVKNLIKVLGTDYCNWYIKNKRNNPNVLFKINNLVSQATMELHYSVDPIIVAMSLIGNIRDIQN